MKKFSFTIVIFFAAVTVSMGQQPAARYTINGFTVKIPITKTISIVCRPAPDGYFPPEQQKAVYRKKYMAVETFRTSQAIEYFKKTLNEHNVKYTTAAKMTAEFEGIGSSIETSAENSYLNRLEEGINTKIENSSDITYTKAIDQKVELEPGKAVQLYEVTVSVPGEYDYTYSSPQIPDQRKTFTYNITYDYSFAPRALFGIIKDIQCGTDQGEWNAFNNIANKAYMNYDGDVYETWNQFLLDITNQLWTDGMDQASWSITKQAASYALQQRQPLNQLRAFCSYIKKITRPSHNKWAWERITNFATQYDF